MNVSFHASARRLAAIGASMILACAARATERVDHVFGGPDGRAPAAPLLAGADGSFYGVTAEGGPSGGGTIYRIDPAGAVVILHEFTDGPHDPKLPNGGLVHASDGNLYGTTQRGGARGGGTIYRLAPDGAFTVVHAFPDPSTDHGARTPWAGVIQGADGGLYGTTQGGGDHESGGVVFRASLDGAVTVLHSMSVDAGGQPLAGLVQASDGLFYGTGYFGGAGGAGVVFRVAGDGSGYTVMHAFSGSDGGAPMAPLVQASDGRLYGTTQTGGAHGHGVVFRMDADGTFALLHAFDAADGAVPSGGLVQARDGRLYGETSQGGDLRAACDKDDGPGCGTVYRMTPGGAFQRVFAFPGATAGSGPHGGLTAGADGRLTGATTGSALTGPGLLFSVGPR